MANTAALRAGGIRFAAGTDAGVTGAYHGFSTLRELKLLVEGGLTPLEALAAATGNAARVLRVAGERGFIAPGMAADLVLVEGAPHRDIADIDKPKRVFLNGVEIDRAGLLALIASPDPSPLPALPVPAAVDSFERDRTLLDTRRVNSTDSGLDNSRMLYGQIWRAPSNRALSLTARMGEKDHPYAQINLPLRKGAVEPADASAFRGVEFEARGDGEYWLVIPTRAVRDGSHFRAAFRAEARWRKMRIPFSALKQERPQRAVPWTARDLLMLSFGFERPAAAFGWLELDNVRFYK